MLTEGKITCDQSVGMMMKKLIITLLFLCTPVTLFGANINNFSVELVEQHRGAHWDTLVHYADQGEDSILIRWTRGSGDSVRIMMGVFGYPQLGYGRHVVSYAGPIGANPTHSLLIHLPEPSLVYFMAYVYDTTAIADKESTTVYVPNDHGGFPQLFSQHLGDVYTDFTFDTLNYGEDDSVNYFNLLGRLLVLDAFADGPGAVYFSDADTLHRRRGRELTCMLLDRLFVLKKTEAKSHNYVQLLETNIGHGVSNAFYKELNDSAVVAMENDSSIYASVYTTTLDEDVDSAETSIDVDDASNMNYGTPGNTMAWIWLDNGVDMELMRVDAVVGNTITVTRGRHGTDGVIHDDGATVNIIVGNAGFNSGTAHARLENRIGSMIQDPWKNGSTLNWPQLYAQIAYNHISQPESTDAPLVHDGRPIYSVWMNDNWADQHYGNYEDHNDTSTFNYISDIWGTTLDTLEQFGLVGNLNPSEGEWCSARSWAGLDGGNFSEAPFFTRTAKRFPDDTTYFHGRDIMVEKIDMYRTSKAMWFETRAEHVNPFCAEWDTDRGIDGDYYVQATRAITIFASCLDGMAARKKWTGDTGNDNIYRWLEEWAVNDSGSCFTYDDTVGSALACTVTTNRHWLGEPLEDFQYEFRSGWAAIRSDILGRFETTGSDSNFSVSGDIIEVGSSADYAHSGDSSYKCLIDTNETGGTFDSAMVTGTLFEFVDDSIYTISFWTLTDSTRFFRWNVKDNDNLVLRSVQNVAGSPGGVWTQHVSWFTTPDTSTSATFNIYLGKEFGQRGDLFYLDDVMIKPTRGWMGLTREFENGFILLNQDPSDSNLFTVPTNCRVLEGVASSYYYSTDTLHNTDSLVTGNLLRVGPENGYMLIYDP